MKEENGADKSEQNFFLVLPKSSTLEEPGTKRTVKPHRGLALGLSTLTCKLSLKEAEEWASQR